MNLEELDNDERTALVGLVLMIVDADDAKSEAEMAEFRAIAAELGRREFDEAFRAAKSQFKTVDDALAFAAAKVTRPGARQIIQTVLHDLASADFVSAEERELLDRVAAGWTNGG